MALNNPSGQPSDSPRPDFIGASSPNRIGYRFLDLDPGANVYIQRDDRIVIQAMSNAPGETITIGIRMLLPGREEGRTQPDASTVDNPLGDSHFGVITPINQTLICPTAFTIATKTIDLAEGYLLSLVMSSNAALTRGCCFVKAFIVRGNTAVANAAYMLCADYTSTNNPIGYPFGRVVSPVEGPGNLKHIGIASPGAGVDWVFTPNTNTRARIISTQARLTTSAVVANRNVSLVVHDNPGGNDVGTFSANLALPATTVGKVSSGSGISPSTLIPTNVSVSLPETLILRNQQGAATILSSLTQNMDAADQWILVEIFVEEWLDF